MVDTDGTFLGTGSSYSPVSVSGGAESLSEMGKKPNLTREERGAPQLPPSTTDGQKGHFLLGEDTAVTQL